MQGPALDGLVDSRNEAAVLGFEGIGVARVSRLLEAAEVGFDSARQAAILVMLARAAEDPLLL
jgi:hypothetical protein